MKSPDDIQVPGLLEELSGTLQGHRDGHGFVLNATGGADVFVPPSEMRAALHGDRVRVRVARFDKRGRPEGRIIDIEERRPRPIIGRLLFESGAWLVAPEDKRVGQDILIPKAGIAQARPGQVVAVELTEPPALYAQPVGRVTEVLGDIDDPGLEIEIAVRKYEVPHEFSPAAVAQAAKLPEQLRAVDLKGRVDLRDVAFVTIDGEDARDFDDAVYCEPIRVGRGKKAQDALRLLVAIADVSHYVKPNEALDLDAHERATSVYFPRRVIPMLPEKTLERPVLAEPGCGSLEPGVRHGGGRRRRHLGLSVLPGGDLFACAPDLHGGGRGTGQHARSRGAAPCCARAPSVALACGLPGAARGP